MFDINVFVFRFANVVGQNQTHGVGLDFLKSLKNNRTSLKILGDGNQSKQYIHVLDLIDAIMHAVKVSKENLVLNVGTTSRISVKEIAQMCLDLLQIDKSSFEFNYTGGTRGWDGDVPLVNISIDKIQNLGWRPKLNSREAMQMALKSIWDQIKNS
jgi:UDP-glucose 4-epimerase